MTEEKYFEEVSELLLQVYRYFNDTQEQFAEYFFDRADWARRCAENDTDDVEEPTVSLQEVSKRVLQEIGSTDRKGKELTLWYIFLLAYCPYMGDEFWPVRYEGITEIEKARVLICQDIKGAIEKLKS